MNGRKIFKRYQKQLNALIKITSILPNSFFKFLMALFDSSESKFVLLLRYIYLKKNIENCGENIFIGKYVTLKNIKKLKLGSNISIHANCYLDAAGGIFIGNNVSIANQTSIISFDHTWDNNDIPIKYNKVDLKPILISDDVWIGNGCRILGGVNIETRSIVAAGAVVTKNVESHKIVGGIPAKIIKEI